MFTPPQEERLDPSAENYKGESARHDDIPSCLLHNIHGVVPILSAAPSLGESFRRDNRQLTRGNKRVTDDKSRGNRFPAIEGLVDKIPHGLGP